MMTSSGISLLLVLPTVSFSLVAAISGFQASWEPGSLSVEDMRVMGRYSVAVFHSDDDDTSNG